jgi:hypothetical protein
MKWLAVPTGLLLVGISAIASAADAGDAGTAHLPDLITLPITDISIQYDKAAGIKELRLSNTVANIGNGRLELRPEHNPMTHITTAFQRVYTHNAGGTWSLQSEFPVGTFEFHPTHGHWHFGGLALYELRNQNLDGSIGRKVLRSSDKVSFCMVDTEPVNSGLEHSGPASYLSCNQAALQGVSVGWGDRYVSTLPGQAIDIAGLPNGTYWLTSTTDPDNVLSETNDANNRTAVKVTIIGNRVVVR